MKKKNKIKSGMYWHVHHNILCVYCYDEAERIKAIKETKPFNEIKTRLRLLKRIRGKLPDTFLKAYKNYREADKNWQEAYKNRQEADKNCLGAYKNYQEADKNCLEAYKNYRKAYKNCLPFLEKLHKKECGCKEWDGSELIFPGKGE